MKIALILIVILFIALSPVIGLRPSLRQKRQIALREMARRHEIRVAVEKSPLFATSLVTVAYRLNYPRDWQGPRFTLVREQEAKEGEYVPSLRWKRTFMTPLKDEAIQALDALLAQLPDDAHALESDHAALTLWWDESLSPDAFEPRLIQLKRVHELLMQDRKTAR